MSNIINVKEKQINHEKLFGTIGKALGSYVGEKIGGNVGKETGREVGGSIGENVGRAWDTVDDLIV